MSTRQGRPAPRALIARAPLAVLCGLLVGGVARGQEATAAPPPAALADAAPVAGASPEPVASDGAGAPQPMFDDSIEAAEGESPPRSYVLGEGYKGPLFTLKPGLAAMYDGSGFSQDDTSKQQVGDLSTDSKWRDFRFLLSGTLPKVPWLLMWKTGIMWDGANEEWLVRETGLIVKIPGLSGHVFIGRTKEGTSLTKQMVGFAVWGLERSPWHDATIPVMADGIRWMGYRPDKHLVWNLAAYDENIFQGAHYPFQDKQAVARIAWLPYLAPDAGRLLHAGLNVRWAEPRDGMLQLKARPENNVAPYFLDTGLFPASHTMMVGPEIYLRNGSWLAGSEYYWMNTFSDKGGDHHFNGGDAVLTWLVTGETRPYSTRGGVFGFVNPRHPVFGDPANRGWGAWEAILRFSYIDANSGAVQGGDMWRISPLLAWHLTENFRWTIGYGYGVLDRFQEKGGTHFLQSRLSFTF